MARLWHQLDSQHRVMLHRLEPQEVTYAHPHPWRLAVLVLGPGLYEMKLGVGPNARLGEHERHQPALPITTLLTPGAQYLLEDQEDAEQPSSWHALRVTGTCYSVAVLGPEAEADALYVDVPKVLDYVKREFARTEEGK